MAIEEFENKPLTIPRGRGNPAWIKGVSGNPGGRPSGLAELVREQTKDGQELVRFMLGVLRGRKTPLRYRLEAAAWLADRGFGKVSQPLTGEGGGPLRFTLVLSAAGAPVEEGVEEGADGDGGGGG